MNIEEILDAMGDLLDKALAVPFSGKKSMIDIEKMSNLISELHANLPNEIKQAREVVNERKSIIADAREEADMIIKRAEERARQLVAAESITKTAQARAEEIQIAAQHRAKETDRKIHEYVDEMLRKHEELFTQNLATLKKARNSLRNGLK